MCHHGFFERLVLDSSRHSRPSFDDVDMTWHAGLVIVGLGIDVVDIARFARTLERTPAVAERLFTAAERDGRRVESLAARFAAKEALAKALGAPRELRWHDAEVTSATDGRPTLRVAGGIAEQSARLGIQRWHVSLSHDAGIATAIVIAEN
jgi:holo-[acyl-carrier protein] synthase